LSFEAALRRTRRIPQTAQTGYLMGIRLERYIAEGLHKLAPGYVTAEGAARETKSPFRSAAVRPPCALAVARASGSAARQAGLKVSRLLLIGW